MERRLRVNYKEFTNCLRIAIVPDELQDERLADVKKYCLKYGFSNVMLFFNAEEYNLGHITKEEATPWIETIKKSKRVLEDAGISVSLNPWIEMGHLDRGRKLKDGQNFTTMSDMYGVESKLVACPWDEEWRKYYFELLGWYLKEVNPDFIWIEDDFRLHNHYPLTYGGCYCKYHMQRFNEKLGKNYTREQLVERVFAKGKPTKERKAWLDVNRETMLDLAEKIGEFIKNLGLKTRVGLMSSAPTSHCMEARDWRQLHENLRAGEETVNRIHLPCYDEIAGKQYLRAFNAISMIVRTFVPSDTYIYPELENGSFTTFTKDPRFLRFQLESSIPLLPAGMTYDIYDFVGNGTIASFGYGEAVKSVTPYLQGVVDLGLKFDDLFGVMLPIDEKAAYNSEIKTDWRDLLHRHEQEICGYIGGLGINGKPTTQKTFRGETVMLIGGSLGNYTDEQLVDLFKHNFVILDGEAVLDLQERGLSRLIGVRSATLSPAGGDDQAYEQAVDGFIVEGKTKYRASCQEKAGDYVKIEYDIDVCKYTETYTSRREYFGVGAVATDNFAVIPYVLCGYVYLEQYNPLRRAVLYEILKKHQKNYAYSNVCGIHAHTFKKGDETALMLINGTVNSYRKVTFQTNIPFTTVRVIDRKGKLVEKPFKREGDTVTVNAPLEYLSTATLVLS